MHYDTKKQNPIYNIDHYQQVIKKQREEIAEKELIINSLTTSLMNEIHHIYIPWSERILCAASKEQNKEKKGERPSFEFMKKELIRTFFDNQTGIKLAEITHCGYESYAYRFVFQYKKKEISITIPNPKQITETSMIHAHYGKYAVHYKENDVCWNLLAASYDIDEVSEKIKNYLEEE